ncbi:FAD binding domain-containing protein [Podospora didyma]|uniref:FAD binding domain-containing protein n=1 Tax=Podospora didyma TaxID=330526 RepID=A0AAE0K688_9PEZI|nr:FAD binding domain-containing protein [Podospora didyma]
MESCDVLIIGAGPVGTVLALELALHRVSFRIIDKFPARSDKSRSLGVHPRTLELLNRQGEAHALISRGKVLDGGAIFINQKLVGDLKIDDLGTTDTEFPRPFGISQTEVESFLDERLAKYGFEVERPINAISITQDDNGVTTIVDLPDGSQASVRSKYVVGCDGAHSLVRHSAKNLTFEGAPYPMEFMLCDARIRDSSLPKDRVSLFMDNGTAGTLAVFPFSGGLVRFVGSGKMMAQIQGDPTLEDFQAFIRVKLPAPAGTLYDPMWITRYRIHSRCVNNYRDRRLFVAGDAAHIHSPAGAQGMNTGIQDSINLGWKLALALHNKTTDPDALLDSYNVERHPIGLRLLSGTDRLFKFMTGSGTFFTFLRNAFLVWVLPWLFASRSRRNYLFRHASGFGINYRGSPLVGTAEGFKGPIRGGDRLPAGHKLKKVGRGYNEEGAEVASVQRLCAGAGHHLLLFAGTPKYSATTADALAQAPDQVSAAMRSDVATHVLYVDAPLLNFDAEECDLYTDLRGEIHAQFGFSEPGYVLVRPDGYVAHIGPLSKLAGLLEFLK